MNGAQDVELAARLAAEEINKFQMGHGMICPVCGEDVDTCQHSNTDVRAAIIQRHFASALQSRDQAARAEERERCAKVAEQLRSLSGGGTAWHDKVCDQHAQTIAAAIRSQPPAGGSHDPH
jgi:hypothetical protein